MTSGPEPTGGYLPIEDYGIIGDLHTVALVGKNGSIDWCCIPCFDAPSVFGALVDAGRGGFFRISPTDEVSVDIKQYYLPQTNILVTRFLAADGVGEVTDFMPVEPASSGSPRHRIMRCVHVVRGSLAFQLTCQPAFNYGRDAHSVEVTRHGAVFAAASLRLTLFSSVAVHRDAGGGVHGKVVLSQGERAYFLVDSAPAPDTAPERDLAAVYQAELRETKDYWRRWLAQCRYHGRWREMVHRSALVLKLPPDFHRQATNATPSRARKMTLSTRSATAE